jgi:hypothetical protein
VYVKDGRLSGQTRRGARHRPANGGGFSVVSTSRKRAFMFRAPSATTARRLCVTVANASAHTRVRVPCAAPSASNAIAVYGTKVSSGYFQQLRKMYRRSRVQLRLLQWVVV